MVRRERARRRRIDEGEKPRIRVSVIAIRSHSELLLVKHRGSKDEAWLLPGGALEYGETLEECAQREIKEEAGVEIGTCELAYISESIAPDCSRHTVNLYVKAGVRAGEVQVGNDRVLKVVQFMPILQLEHCLLHPSLPRKIIAGLHKERSVEYLGNLWAD